jgi:hypothetical protein
MKRSFFLPLAALLLAIVCGSGLAQQPSAAVAPRGVVLEVTYFKGRPFAYQRIGEWSWYELFQRPAGWAARDGELPVAAVKIYTRTENEAVKVRVTVLRGRNHEVEDSVAEYTPSLEKKTVIGELTALGVEPFEIQLVRAPATVPDPPAVVNKTRSLQVTVEPFQGSLPSFKTRVQNNSPKPVAAYAYFTSIDGVRKLSGIPQNKEGGVFIKPGDAYELVLRQPIRMTTVSTGEVPPVQPGLVFNVISAIFTDGSYEGDPYGAASYLAVNYAEKAQLRQIADMLKTKGFNLTAADAEAASRALTVESIWTEFAAKFPEFTDDQKKSLQGAIHFGKSKALQFFRTGLPDKASTTAVADLLDKIQKRIDALP